MAVRYICHPWVSLSICSKFPFITSTRNGPGFCSDATAQAMLDMECPAWDFGRALRTVQVDDAHSFCAAWHRYAHPGNPFSFGLRRRKSTSAHERNGNHCLVVGRRDSCMYGLIVAPSIVGSEKGQVTGPISSAYR